MAKISVMLCLMLLYMTVFVSPYSIPSSDGLNEPVWSLPLSITTLTSKNINSEKCKNDSILFQHELKKFTLWAVQMFDASAKLPSGLLYGATHALGSYDECLLVGANGKAPVNGQYCLMKIHLAPNPYFTWPEDINNGSEIARSVYNYLNAPLKPTGREPRVPAYEQDDPNQSAWVKVQRSVMDPSKRRRDVLHWALCVPSSCQGSDVKIHLDHELAVLQTSLGLLTEVSVERCEIKSTTLPAKPLSNAAISMCAFLGVSVTLVLVSTFYDLFITFEGKYQSRDSPGHTAEKILLCFSIHRNLKRLVKVEGDDECLKCMHGIKLYSMANVILGHRLMFSLGSPIQNPEFVEGYYRRLDTMILLNGFIIVDSFFTITGFLVCFLLITALSKNVRVPLPILYLHRYIRLTPVYALVVAFYATLLPYLGSGPLWTSRVGIEVERCQQNWWLNLLYLNNYVNTTDMCMFQSWYVACDFQLFLFAVPIVWLLCKHPRVGRMVLAAVIVISAAIPFCIIIWKQLDAVLLLYMNTLEDPISNQTFRMMYAPFHTRGSPYFIGMLFGYLTFLSRKKGFKLPQNVHRLCWLVFSILPCFSMLSAWIFYLPGRDYKPLEAAVYGSLHRVGWSLGISWVVFAVCTGSRGIVKLLLCMKPVIALSRLTYCIFLSHGALQLYTVATLRVPTYINIFNLMWMTFGDILMAVFMGGFLCMLFESPILALEKLFLTRRSMKEAKNEESGSSAGSDIQNVSESTDETPTSNSKTRRRDVKPEELHNAFFRRIPPLDSSEKITVISGTCVTDYNGAQQFSL